MLRRLFRGKKTTVPPFNGYYPSADSMSRDQAAFYQRMRDGWRSRAPVPVHGNISYAFCLAYEIIRGSDRAKAAAELERLADAYQSENKVPEYCRGWAADAYFLSGDVGNALRVFPQIRLDGRSTMQTDRLLTLKATSGAEVSGRDVLTLFGPKVTAYAKAHLDRIAEYLDVVLAEIAGRDGSVLEKWKEIAAGRRYPFGAFSGVPLGEVVKQPEGYGFSYCTEIEKQCLEMTRRAENALREDDGLPRVGEGWIAETKLYYDLVAAFPGVEVLQHARTDWLGQQHLDVYIPSMRVAVEYQGAQHDAPVAYFGGEEAFQRVQERDARKRRLCKKNGTALIDVRPGYLLDDIVNSIKRAGSVEP